MTYAITLRSPAPLRVGPMLILGIVFWLASAVCLAPTLQRSAGSGVQAGVCKCAHCSGGLTCCCRLAGKCAAP